jgi:hypothetical protein
LWHSAATLDRYDEVSAAGGLDLLHVPIERDPESSLWLVTVITSATGA